LTGGEPSHTPEGLFTDLRREVARYECSRKIGGSADAVSVVPGPCSTACPRPDVRRPVLPGGVRSSGESPRAARSIRAATGEGNDRTGELREPPLMPRKAEPSRWDAIAGCKDWPLRSGRRRSSSRLGREEHRRPRGRGGTHPGRSSCVRNAVTPSRSGLWSGKPTVRKAQSPGGNRMTEKRMPAAERQRETGTWWSALPADRLG
jgi:hypothetical protein